MSRLSPSRDGERRLILASAGGKSLTRTPARPRAVNDTRRPLARWRLVAFLTSSFWRYATQFERGARIFFVFENASRLRIG